MGIIKKKDLGKFNLNKQIVGDKKTPQSELVDKEPIEELVDDDGSFIEGGTTNSSANSEIKTAPQQTTDDYAASGIQPNNYFYGIYGTPYSRGSRMVANESTKKAVDIIKRIIKEDKK
jgi:hypothetical protein